MKDMKEVIQETEVMIEITKERIIGIEQEIEEVQEEVGELRVLIELIEIHSLILIGIKIIEEREETRLEN